MSETNPRQAVSLGKACAFRSPTASAQRLRRGRVGVRRFCGGRLELAARSQLGQGSLDVFCGPSGQGAMRNREIRSLLESGKGKLLPYFPDSFLRDVDFDPLSDDTAIEPLARSVEQGSVQAVSFAVEKKQHESSLLRMIRVLGGGGDSESPRESRPPFLTAAKPAGKGRPESGKSDQRGT